MILPADLCVDLDRETEFRSACVYVYLQLQLVGSEIPQNSNNRELAREIVMLASSICDVVGNRMTGGTTTPELVAEYIREGTLIYSSRSVQSALIRVSSITDREVELFPA